jgi:hypothetical protein
MPGRLNDTTIRDFGGGWNVADSDINLNSTYQPVSENIVRGIDGSFSPRQGCRLFGDFADGVNYEYADQSFTFGFVNNQPYMDIAWTAHGFTGGGHVTISGITGPLAGVPASEINGTFGFIVVDADTIRIPLRVSATSNATPTVDNVTIIRDTHKLGGNIIHDHYFNRRLLVFTDIGEIGTVDNEGNLQVIWNYHIANTASSGIIPTRRCEHWSCDAFKQTVIACNGYNRDKPLQIFDDFRVEFLVDKATLSNAAVPKADFVLCLQGYVSFMRTEYGDPFIEFSAKGTDGTFTRESDPSDSAEIDLSVITSSVEPTVLGGAQIRDRMYAAFYDRGMIGRLGEYDSNNNHVPDFSDVISEHGTISHRTMVSLGNDILMCDYAGVPSVSISSASGVYVPVRLSELIAPAIQRHLANLSEETLRRKAFATYNRADRTYMLFLPKCDEVSQTVPENAIIIEQEMRERKHALLRVPGHKIMTRSRVRIEGATGFGTLSADDINGVREVVSVVDPNTVVIQLGNVPDDNRDFYGGGNNMTVTPINDESVVYVFEYNKEFKLRRWTRYRDWDFDCACSSQRGQVFMCKGLKVYMMGNNEVPIYGDYIGDYDRRVWYNSTEYVEGIRVRDTDGTVYTCTRTHVSPATGTFEDHRNEDENNWIEYQGTPIHYEIETPWSDMRERGRVKICKFVNLDVEGYGAFQLEAFVNQIRVNRLTQQLAPVRSLQFHAGETGGFGIQYSGTWGGGRRTRDEKMWPFEFRGKLIRWRISGKTLVRQKFVSLTMYYALGLYR